jgi:hypothetical protein
LPNCSESAGFQAIDLQKQFLHFCDHQLSIDTFSKIVKTVVRNQINKIIAFHR